VGKDKLRKFAENAGFSHFFQPTMEEVFRTEYRMKGRWNSEFFGNEKPIVLELGCGKGEYTVGLARRYPDKNFIGIDVKGARMWRGASDSHKDKLPNVAFLRTRIEFIENCFAEGEVSEIWITFPDPQLKKARKRLTSEAYLSRYRQFLQSDGIVHLKTDSLELHAFTHELIKLNKMTLLACTDDLYNSEFAGDTYYITTYYEKMYLDKGKPITYLRFNLDGNEKLVNPDIE
jgi:tRNA (guanine-N7-)-methyltransferase